MNPEKVNVVMSEFCEEMSFKDLCVQMCDNCPFNTNNIETVDRIVEMFNNEL